MTRDEIVKKNISLTFDFIRYLIKHSDMLESIPDGADVEFLEFDYPSYASEDFSGDADGPVFFKVEHSFSKVVEKLSS